MVPVSNILAPQR